MILISRFDKTLPPAVVFAGVTPAGESDNASQGQRSTDDIITDALMQVALRRIHTQTGEASPYVRNEEATDDYKILARATSGLFETMLRSSFFQLPGMADHAARLQTELVTYKRALKWFVRQMYRHTDLLLRSPQARSRCLVRLNSAWMNVKYVFGSPNADTGLE